MQEEINKLREDMKKHTQDCEARIKVVSKEAREDVEQAHEESQERVQQMAQTLEEIAEERKRLEAKVRTLETDTVAAKATHTQQLLEIENKLKKVCPDSLWLNFLLPPKRSPVGRNGNKEQMTKQRKLRDFKTI